MIKTISISVNIPSNHEMQITLPTDIPAGPAEIVVVVASRLASKTRTLGDLLSSEFFGMWHDRVDVGDSAEFAQRLRSQAWVRAG